MQAMHERIMNQYIDEYAPFLNDPDWEAPWFLSGQFWWECFWGIGSVFMAIWEGIKDGYAAHRKRHDQLVRAEEREIARIAQVDPSVPRLVCAYPHDYFWLHFRIIDGFHPEWRTVRERLLRQFQPILMGHSSNEFWMVFDPEYRDYHRNMSKLSDQIQRHTRVPVSLICMEQRLDEHEMYTRLASRFPPGIPSQWGYYQRTHGRRAQIWTAELRRELVELPRTKTNRALA